MSFKNVAIIGASGNLGPSILSALLKFSFNVTVISREGSISTFPPNVKVVRADLTSQESLTSAFQGQDAIVAALSHTAIADQGKIIDAAIAAGVKRYIPSEFGSNTTNPILVELVPVFPSKVDTVKYLKSKEDSISWTSVISGPFFDWGLKVGFLGLDSKTKTARLIDNGKVRFTSTTLGQIGVTIVKILENPDLTKNQYVFPSSFQTTQTEILAAIEKLSGETWTVNNVTSEGLIKIGREKIAKHDYSGVIELIQAGAMGKDNLGDHSVEGLWNEKLGLPKEDFEKTIKATLGL